MFSQSGAAGRDKKGFYRVHQFQKVEQIVFCANDSCQSVAQKFAGDSVDVKWRFIRYRKYRIRRVLVLN
jgi:seryl-tRNA synthetase